MNDIADDVLAARQDTEKMNLLISRYLPFLKKQVMELRGVKLEYDDMLSLAMLTFSGCVQQYAPEKGGFLSFCGACIRNRLLDEHRRQQRYENLTVSMNSDHEAWINTADNHASVAAYNLELERLSLAQEIELFSTELKKFEIQFGDLPRICPKQARSRLLCARLAREIVSNAIWRHDLFSSRRIPQSALSAKFQLSPKTIEKHRRFIVTLAVLMAGDYPHIQAFLPRIREVI